MRKRPRRKAVPSFEFITGTFLPERAVLKLKRHGLNDMSFRNWLADALNGYQVRMRAEASVPPPSESLKILTMLHGSIEQLSASLNSIEPSGRPAIYLQLATHRSFGKRWSDVADRLQQELTKATSAVISARTAIEEQPSNAGAKPKRARDRLLSELVRKIEKHKPGARKKPVYARASDILNACDVPCPKGEEYDKEIGKLVREYRKWVESRET